MAGRKIVLGLINNAKVNKENRILDIGCDTGIILQHLQKCGYSLGIDVSQEAIEFCRARESDQNILQASAVRMPFRETSFDLITLLDLLEHIENDIDVLKEVFRVCKNGGKVVIIVPAFNFLWSEFDNINQHKRRYSVESLGKKTKKAGFKILKLSYMNSFLFPAVFVIRMWEKIRKKHSHRLWKSYLPGIGKLLELLFSSELYVFRLKLNFLFGVSVIVILKK